MIDLTGANWRKSSRSNGDGNACVEVADLVRAVAVRDSKNPQGPSLAFGRRNWNAFADQVKVGRFDL